MLGRPVLETEVFWPYEMISKSLLPPDFEHRPARVAIACSSTVNNEGVMVGLDRLLAYYLFYIRLVHAVAWIRRAVCGLRWCVCHQGIAARIQSSHF